LPIIRKYSDINKYDENIKLLYQKECELTDIYNLGFATAKPCGTEQTSKIITL
jgi:hypothetical protein